MYVFVLVIFSSNSVGDLLANNTYVSEGDHNRV